MMDYKQMAEIVTKEVDAILERKRRKAIVLKRVALTASSLCVAAIIGFGLWNNSAIKNAFRHNMNSSTIEETENQPNDTIYPTSSETSVYNSTKTATETTTKTTTAKTETLESKTTTAIPSTTNHSIVTTSNTSIISDVTQTTTSANDIQTQTTSSSVSKPVVTSTVSLETSILTTTSMVTTERILQKRYVFNISFIDDVSFEFVKGINAKLIRQKIEWIDSDHLIEIGEGTVIDKWDTTMKNPYISQFFDTDTKDHVYKVVVDNLPDEYHYYNKNNVKLTVSGYLDGEIKTDILLTKENLSENTTPLNGHIL